jgi:UDP-galactopyranose mutase
MVRPYSEKMWRVALEELPPAILNRLQFRREGRDSRFTLYTHQGVPTDGFVAMFHEILAGIPVHTSVPKDTWRELKGKCDLLVYTGKVDDYFDLAHGRLRYRSLRIEHEIAKPTPYIQLNECNYRNEWCRAIDHHHWYGTKTDKTVITREYPVEHVDGENFPYYPIVFGTALEQAKLYEDMMKGEPNTLFVGRTATYRYLTIDQTILQVVNAMKSKDIPAIL